MRSKVYVETSVISYLTAWRSRDLVIAGNQETTKEWWDRKDEFDVFISQFVLDEAGAGDSNAAHERINALKGIRELEVVEQVIELAQELIIQTALPSKARLDALHIAVAAVHRMNFLLTWNCTHIANPMKRPTIENVIRGLGYVPLLSVPHKNYWRLSMKITNQIIEEIHAFRAEYAQRYNYDLKAICEAARQKQTQSGHEIVSFFVPDQPVDSTLSLKGEPRGQLAADTDFRR